MRDKALGAMDRDAAPARIVSVGRNSAWIAFEGSDELRLASFRKSIERESIVPGDLVMASPLDDERYVIDRREPRSFALERRTAGGRSKTMAANIDGIAIVSALANPPPHVSMLDELLAFSELHEIEATLLFTKPDLADPAAVETIAGLYRGLGYRTLIVNPKSGQGLDALVSALAARRTLLIGQSGVGKSSLFRALGGRADIGELSRAGRGRQTTSAGRLHYLEAGFLIDSPGVGEFQLHGIPAGEVAHSFVEFVQPGTSCRFTDCSHRSEPGCAVRAAVGTRIAASRYESYTAILARGEDPAPWAR